MKWRIERKAALAVSEKNAKSDPKIARFSNPARQNQTLWHLGGQWRRNRDKAEVAAAVMDRHLAAPAHIIYVRVALIAKLLQGESAIHQNTCQGQTAPRQQQQEPQQHHQEKKENETMLGRPLLEKTQLLV